MKVPERCSEDSSFSTFNINRSHSINLDSLYCSHLWSNSKLRNAIITAPYKDNESIKYCYTCRGKIRKYEVKSLNDNFMPNNHSTPNRQIELNKRASLKTDHEPFEAVYSYARNSLTELESTNKTDQCIPTISHHIDSEIRQKFTSYDIQSNETNQRKLRKSLKGIRCVINFSLKDSPVQKRTQIQACSIFVMIIAIVVISFVLVNFTTPHFTHSYKNTSTIIVVPTKDTGYNESSSAMTNTNLPVAATTEGLHIITTELIYESTTKSNTSSVISKIRKNIKTYPKESSLSKSRKETIPKEINNRDVSKKFCSCQNNEICMLDENSGKSICRRPKDEEDPTGCGGLCALETEACYLVDKERGVRVCRSLTILTCAPYEWRCRNGLCVPAEARCDGAIQCNDRSDEMLCECDLKKQFRCGNSISCFPNSKLCDGAVDCWDAYDEVNCTTECPNDQYLCTDGQCIVYTRFCDGLADCSDGSDEPQGCGGACGTHEIRCKNHRCVPKMVLCDGHDNCGDASDESSCPYNNYN